MVVRLTAAHFARISPRRVGAIAKGRRGFRNACAELKPSYKYMDKARTTPEPIRRVHISSLYRCAPTHYIILGVSPLSAGSEEKKRQNAELLPLLGACLAWEIKFHATPPRYPRGHTAAGVLPARMERRYAGELPFCVSVPYSLSPQEP